jgi:hypothetical protein
VDFVSPVVPDTYPPAAVPQFGADDCKMVRHLFSGCARAGLVLEQHSARIENDITIEEEIKVEARHTLGPASLRSQRLTTSTVAFENLLRRRWLLIGALLHELARRLSTSERASDLPRSQLASFTIWTMRFLM